MQQDGFTPLHFTSDDGLALYGRDYGSGNSGRRPIVCLAGLSRNSRDFHQLATWLADQGRRVITLDYRGRGLSARDPNPANYNIGREAQDVVAALRTLGISRAIFIGTSRGGLILHILPAFVPDMIAACILNDVGPVIEVAGLRVIREYLSARLEPKDFTEAARALKATHGVDFPALGDNDWNDMADAIFRETGGRIVSDYDPALVEPLKTMDMDQHLPDLWPQYEALASIPVMIVRGENSKLFSADVAGEMVARHGPQIELIMARGQGHAPILHIPDVLGPVSNFIASH
ncbi:alpha/beta hydrolase [Rhizobium sp. TH2]|uniref:alpha/beta fold hydrolase n=1 Tax=Rhizobium sp. TH2 TaxID=2775403 RepID=UPI002158108D|nr:alpha/beta hydrolase [Rhizobium sp. TH2]UVC10551.1 alpha/beta hydrolase [Rhizobium sp. TH2]